jgi:hypothetical protein
MSEWEQENADFLKKIGQVSTPAPKPAPTKKDEE